MSLRRLRGWAFLAGGDAPLPGGFHMPFFGSSLKVGALVEPLTSQMAEYLGVPSGLMVKQVARKSEAATAGLKAFDVILKVGADAITTLADWDRSLRANQGKPVQVTVLRDKKQQTLTLQVDSKRRPFLIQGGKLPSRNSLNEFKHHFDVHVIGTSRDIERSQHHGFAESQQRGVLKRSLANHRVAASHSRWFIGEAALLHLREEQHAG
jgi:membrane-associated protease RseP (regulator of RpoE activity)